MEVIMVNRELKYLLKRNNVWWYKRKIPLKLQAQLEQKLSRKSLHTSDMAIAIKRRDKAVLADEQYWNDILNGASLDGVSEIYEKAIKSAQLLNINYKPANNLIVDSKIDALLTRIELLESEKSSSIATAITGGVKKPKHRLSKALKIYTDEIKAQYLLPKNERQKAHFINGKKRSIENFIKLCGDQFIDEIGREHGHQYFNWLQQRISSSDKKQKIGSNTANRAMTDIRTVLSEYFKYFGDDDRLNPFRNLNFLEIDNGKRPSFSNEWIKDILTKPKLTQNMGLEARMIMFAILDTGCRANEICGIYPKNIHLDTKHPYIAIEPQDNRTLKTISSKRNIPLIGVALPAFEYLKSNIDVYKDNADRFSAAANKFLRENELFPTDKHTIYSLRHSFKDRMIEAGIDEEMRDIFMGHAIDKPDYGTHGSIEYRHKLLKKIEIEYKNAIF